MRCYWDCCLAPVAPQRICVTPLNHELLLRQPAGIPRIETEFAESYYSYKSAIFARVSRLGLGKRVGVGGGWSGRGQLALFPHPAFMGGARFRAFVWVGCCLLCEAMPVI